MKLAPGLVQKERFSKSIHSIHTFDASKQIMFYDFCLTRLVFSKTYCLSVLSDNVSSISVSQDNSFAIDAKTTDCRNARCQCSMTTAF